MNGKTIIVYYSFTGRTEKVCQGIAQLAGIPLVRIEEMKPRTTFTAYFIGGFQAISGRSSKIKPIAVDMKEYDHLLVAGPVWASHLTPAVNAFLKKTDFTGKRITILLTCMDTEKKSGKIEMALHKSGVKPAQILVYNEPDAAIVDFQKGLIQL